MSQWRTGEARSKHGQAYGRTLIELFRNAEFQAQNHHFKDSGPGLDALRLTLAPTSHARIEAGQNPSCQQTAQVAHTYDLPMIPCDETRSSFVHEIASNGICHCNLSITLINQR